MFEDSVPVFNSVEEAMDATSPNMALIFVPPPFAADAIVESADAGIPLIACITEGVPGLDMVRVARYLGRQASPAHRPQLPRPHQPRRPLQGGHHAPARFTCQAEWASFPAVAP